MDPRQERSRAAITSAFEQLLAEKDYDQITVVDVIGRAHVGRATFYANFRNKDDLLATEVAKVCGHALDPAERGAAPAVEGVDDLCRLVEGVLIRLLEGGEGLAGIIKGSGSERFADFMRHEVVARALQLMPQEPQGPAASLDRSFLAHHIASSFVSVVRWWAWHGFAASPHALARDYLACILPLFGMGPERESGR